MWLIVLGVEICVSRRDKWLVCCSQLRSITSSSYTEFCLASRAATNCAAIAEVASARPYSVLRAPTSYTGRWGFGSSVYDNLRGTSMFVSCQAMGVLFWSRISFRSRFFLSLGQSLTQYLVCEFDIL
jgi:hypothetical protein